MLLAFAITVGGLAGNLLAALRSVEAIAPSDSSSVTFVIDAGHGGVDCGTVGVNGCYEKDLNLLYAEQLKALLTEAGYHAVLTRTEDRLLYKENEDIPGKRKHYDLKNRLDIAESYDNAVLISIHMNSFSEEKYKGFQVYYSPACEESRLLAEGMQRAVKKELQPWNNRTVKKSEGTIYLLDNATIPAVLVECGFLSNREECALLGEEDYQKQLCFLLFCAMIEYSKGMESDGGSL